ncbi:conotoxin-like protein [Lymantria dispar multiple nucleopolyhedrovirus]|uniref:Conotoxin-like protein n=1 Tax=Lymantria dispar multicapsid nuclear polyhedrosis virus TaxID=10449 RepID=Q9YMR0_NPVLD|nr:conotoxin-like protein [Lymantria dispar multiple nucleopolyhedrovirus]AAC70252.1 conotoxin-like protein [Lymantria dispar multiple nucleopolyhedrovirus]
MNRYSSRCAALVAFAPHCALACTDTGRNCKYSYTRCSGGGARSAAFGLCLPRRLTNTKMNTITNATRTKQKITTAIMMLLEPVVGSNVLNLK